jgi:hypothetical protein
VRQTQKKTGRPARPRLIYGVAPAAAAVAAIASTKDPIVAILASMATLVVFWVAFDRANPRLVGLELIVVMLVTYYTVEPRFAALWMASAAMGGGLGCWLSKCGAREEDYYFLIPAAAGVAFLILVWIGSGLRVGEGMELAAGAIDKMRLDYEYTIERQDLKALSRDDEVLELLKDNFGPAMVGMLSALWVAGLWLAGRLARHHLGLLRASGGALVLFRIRPPYIFVLIAGLVLEILVSLGSGGQLHYLAIPLLAVFAAACFFAGLAVLLFYAAVAQGMGRRLSAAVWNILAMAIILLAPPVAILIGLADVWFDLRRLRAIEQHLNQ